jgi:GTP-dependent dephospho-CoA kinase
MSTASSRSRCAELVVPKHGWVLPVSMRESLSMPLGEVVTESEAVKAAKRCAMVSSVGDVVSLTMIQHNILPHLTIYDRFTERAPMTLLDNHLKNMPGMNVTVRNPPGRITPELVSAISTAMYSPEPTKMLVEGEEDLAGLVCAALGPDGSCLVYGLPKKGLAFVEIDEAVREKAKHLIYKMEESD